MAPSNLPTPFYSFTRLSSSPRTPSYPTAAVPKSDPHLPPPIFHSQELCRMLPLSPHSGATQSHPIRIEARPDPQVRHRPRSRHPPPPPSLRILVDRKKKNILTPFGKRGPVEFRSSGLHVSPFRYPDFLVCDVCHQKIMTVVLYGLRSRYSSDQLLKIIT